MDFYTHEHREIQRTAQKLIGKDVNPYVEQWEQEGLFPAHEVFKKFGEAGLLGITKPEAYGGAGLDYGYNVAFIEALGDVDCLSIPTALGVQTDMATPALANFGSDQLRSEFLAPAVSGDYVACIGVSETGAGSDVANIKTHARKDGDDYVINGQKMWITNSIQADYMVTLVNTGDGQAHKNKSLVVIPMDTPGVERAKKLDKMGLHSSDTGLIYFENVRVPQRFRIGVEGEGFIYQMQQFQEERMFVAISVLRVLERIIANTIDYTRQRMIFGKSVLDNQVVHFRLAELKTEVELLRSLSEKTVRQYIVGEDTLAYVSMLKLKAGRLAREVVDSCLQYWGGMGYMDETLISRFFRDLRLLSIGGGADEVMLTIISKQMGIAPGSRGD